VTSKGEEGGPHPKLTRERTTSFDVECERETEPIRRGDEMLQRRYLVEVQNNRIVVRVTATSYAVSYHRVAYPPWLLPGKFPSRDDHRAPMDRLEFIRSAWQLAKDKAQQLSWNRLAER
jgi:hypothetical protein